MNNKPQKQQISDKQQTPSKQASKQASKQSIKQAIKQASNQASKQSSKQAIKLAGTDHCDENEDDDHNGIITQLIPMNIIIVIKIITLMMIVLSR